MKDYKLPVMNHIDLKVTYACNYQCEYCYQRRADGSRRNDFLSGENAKAFVAFCRRMKDCFHITLAGGEPFCYPWLQYLGEELTALGNYVNIITNFSADFERIRAFIEGCHDRLEWFSISVHLSQWASMDAFYEKLKKLTDYKEAFQKKFHIVLTCVVTRDNFRMGVLELDRAITEQFPEIELQFQRVKYQGRYEIYDEETEAFLSSRGLHMTVRKEEANCIGFYGKECWAGVKFFYVESDGEIMRCYTKQKNNALFRLGNLNDPDGIYIPSKPYPCLSETGQCVCHPHFVTSGFITDTEASQEEIRANLERGLIRDVEGGGAFGKQA